MYPLRGGRLREPAHGGHGDQGDGGQDGGEVEVVHVLHHRGALVGLVTLRLRVHEVQDQPDQAQEKAHGQPGEGALRTRARPLSAPGCGGCSGLGPQQAAPTRRQGPASALHTQPNRFPLTAKSIRTQPAGV